MDVPIVNNLVWVMEKKKTDKQISKHWRRWLFYNDSKEKAKLNI